ncbi:hypothetical protein ACFVZW_19340 [Streptomyces sp. NPDC059567]|uniref:hypothetical protein n=1 Tax=Streptomyces sp. NPDC059567 TaxID=3346867 RepID=UPI003678ACF8
MNAYVTLLQELYERGDKETRPHADDVVDGARVGEYLTGRAFPNSAVLTWLTRASHPTDRERENLTRRHRDVARFIEAENDPPRRVRSPRRRPTRYVPKFGQPDPIGVSNPAELQQALLAVHVWGGSPSLRELERRSNGVLRRSTISDMLRGEPSVPDYDRYLAFLQACGIDDASVDVWVFTWRRLVALKRSPEVAGWMGGMIPASRS